MNVKKKKSWLLLIGLIYGICIGIIEYLYISYEFDLIFLIQSISINAIFYFLSSLFLILFFKLKNIKFERAFFIQILLLENFLLLFIIFWSRKITNADILSVHRLLVILFMALIISSLVYIQYKFKNIIGSKYFNLGSIGLLFVIILLSYCSIEYYEIIENNNLKRHFSTKKPNVIIITIDALRPDHLSCYGYNRKTSPNIDQLAAYSFLFTQAIAQGPGTGYGTPSILSSKYSIQHKGVLESNIESIGLILRKNGYKTACLSTNPYVSSSFGYHKHFDDLYYFSCSKIYNLTIVYSFSSILTYIKLPLTSGTYCMNGEELTERAISWISYNKHNNFFIYIHYMDVHAPYIPPIPYFKLFSDSSIFDGYVDDFHLSSLAYKKGITDKILENIINRYDGCISYVDEKIGNLFWYLKRMELWDNLLIIITADHGEELFEHGGFFHGGKLYDTHIRIPLIIKPPRYSKGRIKINSIAEQVDIMPTVLDFCKIQTKYNMEGISLASFILNIEPTQERNFAISEAIEDDKRAIAVRTHKYKYIEWRRLKTNKIISKELYDLQEDHFEQKKINNAIIQKKLQKIANDFYLKYKPYIEIKENILNIKKEIIDKLKALGYIK